MYCIRLARFNHVRCEVAMTRISFLFHCILVATMLALQGCTREHPTQPTPIPRGHESIQEGVPKINVIIIGCESGIDIVNGMGEVINAWVKVQNAGEADAT